MTKMLSRSAARQLPPAIRSACSSTPSRTRITAAFSVHEPPSRRSRTYTTVLRPAAAAASTSAPRVLHAGFWRGHLIAPPWPLWSSSWSSWSSLRRSKPEKHRKDKEWNPATFFIFMFIFIGSASIHQLRAKQDFNAFVRRSDQRIATLREVLERVQRGEDVDVEKALGTGDEKQEKEWEEVLDEIRSIGVGKLRSRPKDEQQHKEAAGSQNSTVPPPARKETPAHKLVRAPAEQAPIEEKRNTDIDDSSFY